MIAESIINAADELGDFSVPVVVRLQGTNSKEGLALVSELSASVHLGTDCFCSWNRLLILVCMSKLSLEKLRGRLSSLLHKEEHSSCTSIDNCEYLFKETLQRSPSRRPTSLGLRSGHR